MEIFTIGFTRKPAQVFFDLLREHGIERVVDVRLNNTSQLAGYTKRSDLPFLLKELCGAAYEHELLLTPTPDLLHAYRHGHLTWDQYADFYVSLLAARRIEDHLDRRAFETKRTALLCAEPTPDRCHRRLVLEHLANAWGGIDTKHL